MVSTTEQTAVLSSSDLQSFLASLSSKLLVLYPACHQWFPFKEWEKYKHIHVWRLKNRNQAIPVYYQVKPIIGNAKTMFRMINSLKEDEPVKEKYEKKETSKGPVFFL